MEEAGSYDALKAANRGYRGFYHLACPQNLRPLTDLYRLHAALGMRATSPIFWCFRPRKMP